MLPKLWDVETDRAVRAERVALGDAGVVLVDGPLLLGRGLPAELAVHLSLSPAALARATPEAEAWTLPAYARYVDEVDPTAVADLVVRADHPDGLADPAGYTRRLREHGAKHVWLEKILHPGEPLRFIHSSSARREPGVKVSQVEGTDYERRFMGIRRVL